MFCCKFRFSIVNSRLASVLLMLKIFRGVECRYRQMCFSASENSHCPSRFVFRRSLITVYFVIYCSEDQTKLQPLAKNPVTARTAELLKLIL